MAEFAHDLLAHKKIDALTRKLEHGGGGGDNGGMELTDRVAHLETDMKDVRERLTRMEAKIDAFATRADLHEMSSNMIKWMVGIAVGLGAAAITVMTFVLNNATPKQATPSPQPPIIINVPAATSSPAK